MEKRHAYSASFKSKVALEALKESKTLEELSLEFDVHATLIGKWKSYLLQERAQGLESIPVKRKSLQAQIGKVQAQIAFLREKSDSIE